MKFLNNQYLKVKPNVTPILMPERCGGVYVNKGAGGRQIEAMSLMFYAIIFAKLMPRDLQGVLRIDEFAQRIYFNTIEASMRHFGQQGARFKKSGVL